MVEQKKEMERDRVSQLISWGHWFAFFNGLLAMIIGTRYLSTTGYPETLLSWVYIVISTIGHFSFLAFIIYIIFVFPITFLLPYSKILRGYAATVATLSLCILLYDTIIFNDYGLHLNPLIFELAWEDLNALLRGTSYIATPLAIIAIELTAANFIWKRINKIQKRCYGNKIVSFIGLCFISSHLFHIWADAAELEEITYFDYAYPLSYPATARGFMESHGIERPSIIKKSSLQNPLKYPKKPLICSSENEKNILIVAIDSLRADLIDHKTMPFLNQYQRQKQTHSYHLSGGNQYSSGLFSLLYALQGSYIDAPSLNTLSPVFTQELKKQGYQLGLFTPQDINNNKLEKELAIFDDFESISRPNNDSNARNDQYSVEQFIQWQTTQADKVGQNSSPWFALVTLNAAAHYDTPIGFLGIETVKAEIELKPAQKVLFNQYRQSLHFLDQQLATLLSEVDNNTIVIITGISGKTFTSNANIARGDLSPANVKVPLIIDWAGLEPIKNEITYRTNHYGIAPAIMTRVLGCTNPASDYSAGRTILAPERQTWVYVGDDKIFALYQEDGITVINRHGQYQIYDKHYKKQSKQKLSSQPLIEVMRENRRLFH